MPPLCSQGGATGFRDKLECAAHLSQTRVGGDGGGAAAAPSFHAWPPLLPDVVFHLRERDPRGSGFRWTLSTTRELFAGKRIVLFGVPGAFTPTCTDDHLPGYERAYDDIRAAGAIDEVWCTSVNDAFVMFQWAQSLGVKRVRMLPDGNADFARALGMLVSKRNLGFGARSWRYVAVVDDMRVETFIAEPGKMDDSPTDPYLLTSAQQLVSLLAPTAHGRRSTPRDRVRDRRKNSRDENNGKR